MGQPVYIHWVTLQHLASYNPFIISIQLWLLWRGESWCTLNSENIEGDSYFGLWNNGCGINYNFSKSVHCCTV